MTEQYSSFVSVCIA